MSSVNDRRNNLIKSCTDGQGRPILDKLEALVSTMTKQEVLDLFADDSWFRNAALASYEYVTGAVELESYPSNVTLPIADLCNARCTFCSSWLMGRDFLKMEDLPRYNEVLPYATQFGYQGHGEPLASPHIKGLLKHFNERLDPRCMTYTITNGVFLRSLMPNLIEAGLDIYNVSLNAASPAVHEKVMGLGLDAFDDIIATLQELREKTGGKSNFTISMVLTSDNFHEAADFVRLGNAIGANQIYLRTLATVNSVPAGLNYHLLPPMLLEDFDRHKAAALEAIEASKVPVECQPDTWSSDSISARERDRVTQEPPKVFERKSALRDKGLRSVYQREMQKQTGGRGVFHGYVDDLVDNPYNRETPFSCRFIYYSLISTNMSHRMSPCCYLGMTPGYDPVAVRDEEPFHAYWNSEAMMHLRERLQKGPMFQACAMCPMQG